MMETIDDKLRTVLDGMRAALSEGAKARFRDFWRMRKECLELFKVEMHPTKRGIFWSEYTALLKEAHGLQGILDEEMNFQIDQITLAIDALEDQINSREEKIEETSTGNLSGRLLKGPLLRMLKEISFYGICQEKILSLRKEILEIEMRVSQKNKMLSRLSHLGDIVFPERKKLLPEFSKAFAKELQERFPSHKDKIKQYQALLKSLPLPNEVYRKLRGELSEAWDASDVEEKVKRETLAREKQEEKERGEKVVKAIEALEELAEKAGEMEWGELEEAYLFHKKAFGEGTPTKKETIAFKHFSLIIKGAREDGQSLREETQELIDLMRKELNYCGLDIEFAMKLKELIRENREKLDNMAQV